MTVKAIKETLLPQTKAGAATFGAGTVLTISVTALTIILGANLPVGLAGYVVVISVGFSSFVIFSVSFCLYNRNKGTSPVHITVPIESLRRRPQPKIKDKEVDEPEQPLLRRHKKKADQPTHKRTNSDDDLNKAVKDLEELKFAGLESEDEALEVTPIELHIPRLPKSKPDSTPASSSSDSEDEQPLERKKKRDLAQPISFPQDKSDITETSSSSDSDDDDSDSEKAKIGSDPFIKHSYHSNSDSDDMEWVDTALEVVNRLDLQDEDSFEPLPLLPQEIQQEELRNVLEGKTKTEGDFSTQSQDPPLALIQDVETFPPPQSANQEKPLETHEQIEEVKEKEEAIPPVKAELQDDSLTQPHAPPSVSDKNIEGDQEEKSLETHEQVEEVKEKEAIPPVKAELQNDSLTQPQAPPSVSDKNIEGDQEEKSLETHEQVEEVKEKEAIPPVKAELQNDSLTQPQAPPSVSDKNIEGDQEEKPLETHGQVEEVKEKKEVTPPVGAKLTAETKSVRSHEAQSIRPPVIKPVRIYKEEPPRKPTKEERIKEERIKEEDPVLPTRVFKGEIEDTRKVKNTGKVAKEEPIKEEPIEAKPVVPITVEEYRACMTDFHQQTSILLDVFENFLITFVTAFKKTERKSAASEVKKIQRSLAAFKSLLHSYFDPKEGEEKLFRLLFNIIAGNTFSNDPRHLIESADLELALDNLASSAAQESDYLKSFLGPLKYKKEFVSHLNKIKSTKFSEKVLHFLDDLQNNYAKLKENPADIHSQVACCQAWIQFVTMMAHEAKFDDKELEAWNERFLNIDGYNSILSVFVDTHNTLVSNLSCDYSKLLKPLIEFLSNQKTQGFVYKIQTLKDPALILLSLRLLTSFKIDSDTSAEEEVEFKKAWKCLIKTIGKTLQSTESQALKECFLNLDTATIYEFTEKLTLPEQFTPRPLQITAECFSKPSEVALFFHRIPKKVPSDEFVLLVENYNRTYEQWKKQPLLQETQEAYLTAWKNLLLIFAIGYNEEGVQQLFRNRSKAVAALTSFNQGAEKIREERKSSILTPFLEKLPKSASTIRKKLKQTTLSEETYKFVEGFRVAMMQWEGDKKNTSKQKNCLKCWNQCLVLVGRDAKLNEEETLIWKEACQSLCCNVDDTGNVTIISFEDALFRNLIKAFNMPKFLEEDGTNPIKIDKEKINSVFTIIKEAPRTSETGKFLKACHDAVMAIRKKPNDDDLHEELNKAWMQLIQHVVFHPNYKFDRHGFNMDIVPIFIQNIPSLLYQPPGKDVLPPELPDLGANSLLEMAVSALLHTIGEQYEEGGNLNEAFLEEKMKEALGSLEEEHPTIYAGFKLVAKGAVTSPGFINTVLNWIVFPLAKPHIGVVAPMLGSSKMSGQKELDQLFSSVQNIIYTMMEPVLEATFKGDSTFRSHIQGIMTTPYLRMKTIKDQDPSWSTVVTPFFDLADRVREAFAVGELFAKNYSIRRSLQQRITQLQAPSSVGLAECVSVTCYDQERQEVVTYQVAKENLTSYFQDILAVEESGKEKEQETVPLDLTQNSNLPKYTSIILQYLSGEEISIEALQPADLLIAATYFDVPALMIHAQHLLIEEILETGDLLNKIYKQRDAVSSSETLKATKEEIQGTPKVKSRVPSLLDLTQKVIFDELFKEEDDAYETHVKETIGDTVTGFSLLSVLPFLKVIKGYHKPERILNLYSNLNSLEVFRDSLYNCDAMHACGWHYLANFMHVLKGIFANQELEEVLKTTQAPQPQKSGIHLVFNKKTYICRKEDLPLELQKNQTVAQKKEFPHIERVLQYLCGQLKEEAICQYKMEDIYQLMQAARYLKVERLQLLGQRLLIDHLLHFPDSKYNLVKIKENGWAYLATVLESYELNDVEALASRFPIPKAPAKPTKAVQLTFNGRTYICEKDTLPSHLKKNLAISQGSPPFTDRILQYLSGQLSEESIRHYGQNDLIKLMEAAHHHKVPRLELLGQHLLINRALGGERLSCDIKKVKANGWIHLARFMEAK